MSARLLMVRELRRPDRDGTGERDVVDSIPRGMDTFPVAAQLWRLVDSQRADLIEAVYARVNLRAGLTDDDIRYEADDLRALVDLFDGLRAALQQAAIVNHELKIAPDKVAELAPRLPGLDLRATRPAQDVVWALAEGIVNVEGQCGRDVQSPNSAVKAGGTDRCRHTRSSPTATWRFARIEPR